MSQAWFYCGPQAMVAGAIDLSAEESRHAQGSRRLSTGAEVTLFDGLGTVGRGVIAGVGRSSVRVVVQSMDAQTEDVRLRLTVATALPKGSRQDTLFEKCTELGVSALWPMICERSVVKPQAARMTKWRRTAIEACKQARRARLPDIAPPRAFEDVVSLAAPFDHVLLAHREGQRLDQLKQRVHGRVLAFVGPEGGLSPQEIDAAIASGAVPVCLAPTVLRIETAAMTVAAQLVVVAGQGT